MTKGANTMPNWTYNEMKFENKKDFERIVKEWENEE